MSDDPGKTEQMLQDAASPATEAEACDDDGTIVSIPAGADLEECKARGRLDFANGVNAIDCPYVCGYPVYAWEEGWNEARERRMADKLAHG